METHTLRSAVWQKFVSFVEEHSVRDMLVIIGLFFLAGILSAAAIDLPTMVRIVDAVMEWHHNALPTVLLTTFGVFSAPALYREARSALSDLCEMSHDPVPQVDSIEGIPTDELLDHLFTAGTFTRADAEKFGMTAKRHNALVSKLKELGILTHGANNSTVLAAGARREDVAALLSGKTKAEELKAGVRIVRPLPYSPTPSPAFKIRAVSAIA